MRRTETDRRNQLRRLWAMRLKQGYRIDSVPAPPAGATLADVQVQDDHAHHMQLHPDGFNIYTHNGKWWGVLERSRKPLPWRADVDGAPTVLATVVDRWGCYWRAAVTGRRVNAWRTCGANKRRPVWFGPRFMKPRTHRLPDSHATRTRGYLPPTCDNTHTPNNGDISHVE